MGHGLADALMGPIRGPLKGNLLGGALETTFYTPLVDTLGVNLICMVYCVSHNAYYQNGFVGSGYGNPLWLQT